VAAADAKLHLGEVYRGVVRTLREQWRLLLAAGMVVFVPLGFVEALDDLVGDVDLDEIGAFRQVEVVVVALVHSGTALCGEIFYTGVVAAGVSQLRGGERHGLRHVARILPYRRLIAVDLLFSAIVLVGFLLLVVPGILFLVWFSLAGVVVKLEGRSAIDALRRSRELVRGSFWRVLAVVIPAELVSSAIVDAGGELGHDLAEGFAGEWLGATLGQLLATPLYAVAIVVVAYELLALDSRS
jgi:hypothetical protein